MAQVVDRSKRTPQREARFLEVLATGASVYTAATMAGIARRTVYEWRGKDEAFRASWDDAVECGTDLLEDEALRRAKDGVTKLIYYQGVPVGEVQEFSDTLMINQLRARRRDKYSDKAEMNLAATVHVKRLVFTGDGPPPALENEPDDE